MKRSSLRPLTSGETELARSVFGDSIDYARVRVHRGRLIPLLQHEHTAMSPFGVMHYPPPLYEADFSQSDKRRLFIHEMAHIWQHALGLKLWLDGGIIACKGGYGKGLPAYRYHDHLDGRNCLSQFNMEQQADIIADYFVFRVSSNNAQLRRVLDGFVRNPGDALLLPKHTDVPAI